MEATQSSRASVSYINTRRLNLKDRDLNVAFVHQPQKELYRSLAWAFHYKTQNALHAIHLAYVIVHSLCTHREWLVYSRRQVFESLCQARGTGMNACPLHREAIEVPFSNSWFPNWM